MPERAAIEQRRIADQAVVLRQRAGVAEGVVAERHGRRDDGRVGVARADVRQRHGLLEAKRVVRVEAGAQARGAGGAAAVVVGAGAEAETVARLVGQRDHGAARCLARQDLHLGLVAAQAVDLVDALLQVGQLERVARRGHRPHRAGIGQPAARLRAVGQRGIGHRAADRLAVDPQRLDLARHHGNGQHAVLEVLGRQIGARGNEAARDEHLGQPAQQQVDAVGAERAVHEGLRDAFDGVGIQHGVAGQLDAVDVEGRARLGHGIDGGVIGHRWCHGDLRRGLRGLAVALGVLALAQGALGRVFKARPRRRGRRNLHLCLGSHGPQQGGCQRERLQFHRTALLTATATTSGRHATRSTPADATWPAPSRCRCWR